MSVRLWTSLSLVLLTASTAWADVRFLALGDAGNGNEDARKVADAARRLCEARGGCDFALLLGDNVYPRGIEDADDPHFDAMLGDNLERIGVPAFAVLGNHDYGAPRELPFLGGVGLDPRRAEAQVERGRRGGRFMMPDRFWRIEQGPVEIVGLDTTPLAWADRPGVARLLGLDEQVVRMRRVMRRWDEEARLPWRIAIGHHPVRSNGPHGDAGRYGGPLGAIAPGHVLKRFLDERVLGRFDAYLAGHDHSLQDLGDEQGTALFVSGAASSVTSLPGEGPALFGAAELGFLLVEADARRLTFFIVGVDGEGAPRVVHRRALTAPRALADRTPPRASAAPGPAPRPLP